MKQSIPYILMITIVGLNFSCQHADEDDINPVDLEPTLSSIQANIFNSNCALSGCHTGPNPQQGMNLSEGQAFQNIVNVSSNEMPNLFRVNPGNPDESYLYLKITGAPSIIGGRMPLGRTPLSPERIDTIRQWIMDGALNN